MYGVTFELVRRIVWSTDHQIRGQVSCGNAFAYGNLLEVCMQGIGAAVATVSQFIENNIQNILVNYEFYMWIII